MDTKSILLILFFKTCVCDLEHLFKTVNEETGNFSATAANLAWESSIKPGNTDLPARSATYQKNRIIWQEKTCKNLVTLLNRQSLNSTQRRQTYLLCRGPKFTFEETRYTSQLYEELQSIYEDAEICIPNKVNINSTQNPKQVESAILNYLTNVKRFLKFEHEDWILFAAKMAVHDKIQDKNMLCLKGEADFDKMMSFSRREEVLRWLWLVWREKVGIPMKKPYRQMVKVENRAARRNGYTDIGASWREELEIPGLRHVCRQLYDRVKPLYALLHGVMRFYLRRYYGEVVPARGPIPAHLLGNLWSQNWEPLVDLLIPQTIDLDESIKNMNWTVMHMAKRAEDFYQSLGLPAMTEKFWRESVFTREKNSDMRCHGTAADMFQDGDFRLLYCSETSKEDLYVLHHELGHIQYYMAYDRQPALFRQANSALHESIGDAIMYGVLTPQHLNRLGLINDSLLYTSNVVSQNHSKKNLDNIEERIPKTVTKSKEIYNNVKLIKQNTDKHKHIHFNDKDNFLTDILQTNNVPIHENGNSMKYKEIFNNFNENIQDGPNLFQDEDVTTDMILLLKQALNKIPQIPFSLVMDEYRWKYFEGSLKRENKEFWALVMELQGVAPPSKRGEDYFDAGAKFHVPDNTPYIRYFLSSFLQHQLFEKLCKASVFGRRNADGPVPETISLTRCDIYGSKAAGKVLQDFMSRGHSQHWSEILQATTGEHDISAAALNRYYQPLFKLLDKFVRTHRIPIGW